MVLALLLSLAVVQDQPSSAPAVRLKLNHEQFTTGDRAKVFIEPARDGHLVVLHADAEGRVRVLFPLDPTDDDFVRGGRRQELRNRSDRDAFVIDADDGSGMVLAAVATDAFDYAAFTRNDHWDFRALGGPNSVKDDPLAGLLDIVHRMAGTARFEYDAATYVVSPRQIARYGYGYGSHYGYGYPYRFRLGLSFGYPYRYGFYDPFYNPFCYDPFWGWGSSCYGFGYDYGYTFGYGYRYYRPRQFVFNQFASGFTQFASGFTRDRARFVIPSREGRGRYTPVQPRTRSGFNDRPSIRDRQPAVRGTKPQPRAVEPRRQGGGRASVAPRSSRPPRMTGGSPSGSRGGSRPAARPSGGRRRP